MVKRTAGKNLIHLATETLQDFKNKRHAPPSQSNDEFDIAGKKYVSDLKGPSNSQRMIAGKLVSEITFFGKVNQLTPQTNVQINQQPF